MKKVYGLLCVVGFIAPAALIMLFLAHHGFDLALAWRQLTTGYASLLFLADLGISALTFWTFAIHESRRQRIPLWWLALLATMMVGLSLGLPLFLLLREMAESDAE
jgi:hypothetical protein